MRRPLWLLCVFLFFGCGGEEPRSTSSSELRGVRNDAIREASAEYDLPEALLMALGYQQGRFEPAPSPLSVPEGEEEPQLEPPDDPTEPQPPIEADGAEYDLMEDARPEEAPEEWKPDPSEPADTASAELEQVAYGIMFLTPEQVRLGAELTGWSEPAIQTEIEANIDAAAAILLDMWQHPGGDLEPRSDEALDAALVRFVGFSDLEDDAAQLVLEDLQRVLESGFDLTTEDGERLRLEGSNPQSRQSLAAGDYPPVSFISSPNQSSRNGAAIHFVIIHDIEGTRPGAISAFRSTSRQASAHYFTAAGSGTVVQMVSESRTAWHCGNGYYNATSIGIEHEGFADRPNGGGYYSQQYAISTCSPMGPGTKSRAIDTPTTRWRNNDYAFTRG